MKRRQRQATKMLFVGLTCLSIWLAVSTLLSSLRGSVIANTPFDIEDKSFQDSAIFLSSTGAENMTEAKIRRFDLVNKNKVKVLKEWKAVTSAGKNGDADDVILRLGFPRSKQGFLTIGLSTVPRVGAFYLLETIGSLVEAMDDIEKKEVVIVIFLASLDEIWLTETLDRLDNRFHEPILEGLILVVQPKSHIYPDFQKITKRNFNDPLHRVHWRTKQNIDYSYLFSYCKNISQYYIHIEDDVTPSNNFMSDIKKNIFRNEIREWFCIEFSSLGFIGKLFRSTSLQLISDFLLLFKEEQPCDLLLKYLKQIMMQTNTIRSALSLFQHRGVISSLENKTQLLVDRRFKESPVLRSKNFKKRKIVNPPASLHTNLTQYRTFSANKAYISSENDFFWCTSPARGSYFTIEFENPMNLSHIYVQTGHPVKGIDKLEKGAIRVGFAIENSTCGDFVTVATFVHGVVDINTWQFTFPPDINCVEILVLEDQSDWLIINEIGLY